jgi:hypothetical protein
MRRGRKVGNMIRISEEEMTIRMYSQLKIGFLSPAVKNL